LGTFSGPAFCSAVNTVGVSSIGRSDSCGGRLYSIVPLTGYNRRNMGEPVRDFTSWPTRPAPRAAPARVRRGRGRLLRNQGGPVSPPGAVSRPMGCLSAPAHRRFASRCGSAPLASRGRSPSATRWAA
jgi:hypothetical protein